MYIHSYVYIYTYMYYIYISCNIYTWSSFARARGQRITPTWFLAAVRMFLIGTKLRYYSTVICGQPARGCVACCQSF